MLRRYVVREVGLPFLAWTALLCVLLFVMSFLRGAEVLLGSAVTPLDFAKVVFYLMPGFLTLALPISFLLAILLGLGRLVEDGELRAMQALGVSPALVMGGPVALGLVLTGVLALLISSIQPWGMAQVRVTANDIIRRNLMHDLKPGVFHDQVNGITLYTGDRDASGQWHDVMLYDARDPERPLLVTAPRGDVRSTGWEDGVLFELDDGAMHRAVGAQEYAVVKFGHATIRAGIGDAFSQKNQFGRAREDSTPAQLLEAATAARARGENPRPFEVTFHWRVGQMLMPLSFAFLGGPLAIARRRGGRGWGVFFALAGYASFYVVARLAVQLADAGQLDPALAGQLPNLVFIAIGLALLVRVVRRGSR